MKKYLLLFLSLCLGLGLVSCGGGHVTPSLEVKKDAYQSTPQELIAVLNRSIKDINAKNTEEERAESILTLPDFVASGEDIIISEMPEFLAVNFKTTAKGDLTEITFTFTNSPQIPAVNVKYSMSYYVSVILSQLMQKEDFELASKEVQKALAGGTYTGQHNQSNISATTRDFVTVLKFAAIPQEEK